MRPSLRGWASSYRTRLALVSVGIAALVAGAWAWSLYGPLTAEVTAQQRAHLTTAAQMASHALTASRLPLAEEVRALVAGSSLRMTVVAADGSVLADSQAVASSMANHADRPEIREALAGRVGSATRLSSTQNVAQMYVAVPGELAGERVAVRVSEPQARVDAVVGSARRTGILTLLASLALALAVTWGLSSRAARPVTRLADAARAMAAGDLRTPVASVGGELGEVAGALVTLRDQIRARMSELEQEQALLRTVLDGLPDAVLLLADGRVEYANVAVGRMFDTPSSGWEGHALTSPALPASLVSAIQTGIESQETRVADLGPDPLMRYLRVITLPLTSAPGSSRTLAVVSDVTDRRRLDAVRRDFVANASHELKTPVAAIVLLADSAAAASADGDARQSSEFVTRIGTEADRLRRLVSDLLDLSRLDAPPDPDSITDMRGAVDRAVVSHRAAAAAAGLALDSDDSRVEGQDVYASADPTDVAVALDNVIANAIAYTPSGSVRIALDATDRDVTVVISDTGTGIAPEHLPRVFERFYRVDSSRTRDAGGTGLGLSLVRNAVARSGGAVAIDSTPGEGTTVTIALPRAT